MITEIAFTKVSGAGNDFVIIDNRADSLPANRAMLAQRLCSRHFGIGADGLLLLERSSRADFAMKYFNSDGSYGGMCGNGGRCIARYAFVNGIAPRQMTFDALDFVYKANITNDAVSLTMRDPSNFRTDLRIETIDGVHQGFFVDTGSPHFVEFVNNVGSLDVNRIGHAVRNNFEFLPDGTNVNFVEVMNAGSIHLRTYERGVEAETLACGTGAVASGLIAHLQRGIKLPVKIQVKSGEYLGVNASITHDGQLRSPELEGSAHILFSGRLLFDTISNFIPAISEQRPL